MIASGDACAATGAAVRLRDIRKSFGGVAAVAGVDLDIVRGEFFTMLGPSGAGKTTLLRMIAGFEIPDEGTIEFPLTNHPKDQRRVYACIHPRDVIRYEQRPARTEYRVISRAGRWALVQAKAGKALRNQLRAHFSAIEHPLAGDELYGGHVIRALGRHALHASRVAFGGDGAVKAFEATVPLPKDMTLLLDAGNEQDEEASVE